MCEMQVGSRQTGCPPSCKKRVAHEYGVGLARPIGSALGQDRNAGLWAPVPQDSLFAWASPVAPRFDGEVRWLSEGVAPILTVLASVVEVVAFVAIGIPPSIRQVHRRDRWYRCRRAREHPGPREQRESPNNSGPAARLKQPAGTCFSGESAVF
jgi:hypothetical protein